MGKTRKKSEKRFFSKSVYFNFSQAEGDITRRQGIVNSRLEVGWDVGQDDSKKLVGNAEINMNPETPSFVVKGEVYPNHLVEVSGNLKNDKKGWYHVERDLEGALNVKTSFR